MLFNFLSPPRGGGEYRGGFLSLIWTKAAITPNIGALLPDKTALSLNNSQAELGK